MDKQTISQGFDRLVTTTLAGILPLAANAFPDKACIITATAAYTYRQVNSYINALANGLLRLGLKPGDKVAVLIPNSLEYIVCFFAVLKINAVLVPINVKYKGEEVRYVLEHSDAAALIIAIEFQELFETIRPGLTRLEHVIGVDRREGGKDKHYPPESVETDTNYATLISQNTDKEPQVPIYPSSESVIFYTSGTTGRPKGAVCTHRNCLAAIDSWIEAFQINEQSCSLMVTPFFHNAFNAFVVSLFRVGGSTVVLESFQIKTLLSEITRTKPTLIFATPSIYIAMLDAPQLPRYDLSSLTTVVYGAAPMPIEVIKRLGKIFCNGALYNAYAQSETCPAISYLEPRFALTKAGSVGKAVRSINIAILDPHHRPLPPKTIGEICCRGANVMKEYYKQPEVTASKITDGWLHTGDLGYLDEEGFLYLVDRKDDLIISSGENIYPQEIEEVLYTHPDILEAAVIGVPDRLKGNVVATFVVPKLGKALQPSDLKRFCVERLADFKVPRHIRILEVLPRNPSGKVLKSELRRQWEPE